MKVFSASIHGTAPAVSGVQATRLALIATIALWLTSVSPKVKQSHPAVLLRTRLELVEKHSERTHAATSQIELIIPACQTTLVDQALARKAVVRIRK